MCLQTLMINELKGLTFSDNINNRTWVHQIQYAWSKIIISVSLNP